MQYQTASKIMASQTPQVFTTKKLLLVLLLLNVILIIQDNMAVEGIFFLDLLCATRIGNLERQVSNLVAQLAANSNTNSGVTQAASVNLPNNING